MQRPHVQKQWSESMSESAKSIDSNPKRICIYIVYIYICYNYIIYIIIYIYILYSGRVGELMRRAG